MEKKDSTLISSTGSVKKILVALGGNALIKRGEKGTAQEQLANARGVMKQIVELLEEGNRLVITHGNGPQVGDILLKNEIAKKTLPQMPLDVCGAESQGMLGYMLQQALDNEAKGHDIKTASIITQTIVDFKDHAFKVPSKPVGPFYSEDEAIKLQREKAWTMIFESGRGYRRVVPSPKPVKIVETEVIRALFEEGIVVISSGGGGIPVIRNSEGELAGVEAVIDKDLSASLLASELKMNILLILTDVEKVALNFGKSDQKNLDSLTRVECSRYMKEGQFAGGSMGPKIEAAMNFIRSGGEEVIITSLETASQALKGEAGTRVTKN